MCSVAIPALAGKPAADFSLTFPPEPRWVRGARDAVRTALTPVVPGLVDTATLLTSELVTNAVTATLGCLPSSHVALYAEWSPAGAVRVLVHDTAPGVPELPGTPVDEDAEHGRGLLLISLFASEWGVCHHAPGRGKVVWFTLDAAA
ncbi:ATP-binding protein [Streptomyces litchfieldiae]|uniref:ATP-binding protein n=1 Tax=Streptomyces litchfieldiae TaxID=3075543 RepID=A0ABU2MZ62_9ACTN|nr:ATP-binding protein [Streptomyces sp. DSM 44938]MDT0346662.1 ATP-binding protein [Streptomyces sp. DSM 44938]